MKGSRRTAIVGLLLVGTLAGARPAAAEGSPAIVLPRPGQVGIGIQGEVGTLLKTGDLGDTFGAGPGLCVRLRYRMRFERAFGLSFESQTFTVRNRQPDDSTFASKQLTLTTSGVELYQLFGTDTRTTRMLSLGVGLAQTNVKLNDGEIMYPGDGLYASLGAGVERFFYRSWAYDLSMRYMTVFHNGGTNHDFQASVGLIFYASY